MKTSFESSPSKPHIHYNPKRHQLDTPYRLTGWSVKRRYLSTLVSGGVARPLDLGHTEGMSTMSTQPPRKEIVDILHCTIAAIAGASVTERAGRENTEEIIRLTFFCGHTDPSNSVDEYIKRRELEAGSPILELEAFAECTLAYYFKYVANKLDNVASTPPKSQGDLHQRGRND